MARLDRAIHLASARGLVLRGGAGFFIFKGWRRPASRLVAHLPALFLFHSSRLIFDAATDRHKNVIFSLRSLTSRSPASYRKFAGVYSSAPARIFVVATRFRETFLK
jgi:hypothetical protein